jgi:hypothetical protein
VIDLDNTLLNNEHQISQLNRDVIKKVQTKGIEVIIATGRMYVSARPYINELTLKTEAIVYNGAMVKDITSGQVKYHKPLDKNIARVIIKDLKREGLHINLYQHDKLYVDQDNEHKKRYEEVSGVQAQIVDNLVELDFDDPTKLLIIEDDSDKHKYYQKYLREKYGNKIDVTESTKYFIEVGAKDVNKGKTLQQISQDKGIKQEEVMAIGDSFNDIEMLKYAGTAIAMENAAEAVKKTADIIAPHHAEDGVAKILDKLVLS